MTIKIDPKAICFDIVVFLVIFLSSAFQLSVLSGTMRIILLASLFLFILMYAVLLKKWRFGMEPVLILFLGVMSFLINRDLSNSFFVFILYISIAILFSNLFEMDIFVNSFTKIIYIISLSSLILFFLDFAVPSVINLLPVVRNSTGYSTHSILIALSPIEKRNYGIFWEPGAYQTFIIFASFFEIFYRENTRKNYIIVYVLALVTTFSTTGYISIMALGVAALINSISKKERIGIKWRYLIAFSIGFIVVIYILAISGFDIDMIVFKKFSILKNSDASLSSAGVRIYSLLSGFKAFLLNPVFGLGVNKYEAYLQSQFSNHLATCTWMNWFAEFGLFFGIIMIKGIITNIKRTRVNYLAGVMIFLALMATISSEEFATNPSIVTIIFYGLLPDKRVMNETRIDD